MSSSAASTSSAPVRTIGTFCWHELHTRDRNRAAEFYGQLIGWTTSSQGPYTGLLTGTGAYAGGIMDMPAGVPEQVPPHWVVYLSVDDVDASAARVAGLGGKLLAPPHDVPNVGRMCTIADPTGATLQLFKGVSNKGPESGPGTFCWTELLTHDPAKAKSFYAALVGWTTTTMPLPTGEYTMFWTPDAKPEEMKGCAGGMMKIAEEWGPMPSCWLSYIHVEDVDATASKIVPLGGTLFCPPTDIPGIGRFAVASDPTGGMFALYMAKR
ncbi:MAG: VOC family protein [Phycisphaerae bacterium]|nr:VOC family protein [Phycisphaerae bacterium]